MLDFGELWVSKGVAGFMRAREGASKGVAGFIGREEFRPAALCDRVGAIIFAQHA